MKYFAYVTDKDGKEFTLEHQAQNKKVLEESYKAGEILDDKGRPYRLDKLFTARGKHICKYCGQVVEYSDKDLLCYDCRSVLGHTWYSEL